tara:strand:- start:830 stop:1177 length:348 start_codon:yes stop_codon:yes gene_type:complete
MTDTAPMDRVIDVIRTDLPHEPEEDLIYLAKLCEQCERYEEMAGYMIMHIASEGYRALNAEERNLLSVGFKNAVSIRRSAWRIVQQIEYREMQTGTIHHSTQTGIQKNTMPVFID